MVSPFLLAQAYETVDRLTAARAAAKPLSSTRIQLLVSAFYEGLRGEYEQATDPATRGRLAAVLDQCRQVATGEIKTALMLAELQVAIEALQSHGTPPRPTRPALRVIQGGLS